MPANNALRVTELDFDAIKSGLKNFIKAKPEFLDYNFEGSTISLLLDILAYNTYQNAFFTSMIGNEMFLDSALIRDSIVSRAKMLGYTPRSARGSSTTLDVVLDDPGSTPASITIDKNEEFTTIIDGVTYTFVTPQAYTVYEDNGTYATTIKITEGTPLNHKFTVNDTNPIRYIIPNENVDTTSITINVREFTGSSNVTNYALADDIFDVTGNSAVYFLQEVANGQYEVIFGDGVLGKQLDNLNIVEVDYRVCNGKITNDVSTFTPPSTLGGTTFTYTVNTPTSGGDEVESNESIQFQAPKSFATQNRAVLDQDYKNIILENFGDIRSVRVWGGETNDPPVYGKVFISARPFNSTFLSLSLKEEIKALLKQYNVLALDVEFIDPTYLYIIPNITVYYDSRLTSLTAEALASSISNTITDYEQDFMGQFENTTFRYSRFVKAIDETNVSIENNSTQLELQKRFTPNFNTSTRYTLDFGNSLVSCRNDGSSTIVSSSFVVDGFNCFLDDDGNGVVRRYYIDVDGVSKVYVDSSQGTIDYINGIITLNSFAPVSANDNEIRVNTVPRNNDIQVDKHQLMLFAQTTFNMVNINTNVVLPTVTVNTIGSVTQINETSLGTVV